MITLGSVFGKDESKKIVALNSKDAEKELTTRCKAINMACNKGNKGNKGWKLTCAATI